MIGTLLKLLQRPAPVNPTEAVATPPATEPAAAPPGSIPDRSILEKIRLSPTHPVWKGEDLLNLLPRWPEVRHGMYRLSRITKEQFDAFYLRAIVEYANRVQFMPGSESHHHAYPLGQLEHTIEVIEQALLRRQARILPIGAEPERRSREEMIWTYAVFAAALCHDSGKPIARFVIHAKNRKGEWVEYSAAGESLVAFGATEYRLTWNQNTVYEYHHQVALSLFAALIPDMGRVWLSRCPQAFSQLMAYLYGDQHNCGVIGEIAYAADGASSAANLGHKLPTGSAIDGPQRMPLHKRAELVIREMTSNWTINGKASKAQGNSGGSDAWVVGDYVFARSTLVNDLHAQLSKSDPAAVPEPNVLYTKLADMSVILSHEEGGKKRSVFYVNITAADGHVVAPNFSVMVFPIDRIYKLGQRPEQFDGTIEVIKPVLPASHVLSMHTKRFVSLPSSSLGGSAAFEDEEAASVEQPSNPKTPSSSVAEQQHARGTPTTSPASGDVVETELPAPSAADPRAFFGNLLKQAGHAPEPAPEVGAAAGTSVPPIEDADAGVDEAAPPPNVSEPSRTQSPLDPERESSASSNDPASGYRRLNERGDYLPSEHVDVDPPIVRAFFRWLRESMELPSADGTGKLITMNKRGALVHGVSEIRNAVGLVSPKVFNDFLDQRGYVFGDGEYASADGVPFDGLQAELHHLQALFRGSKWAVHNGESPGQNVFTYAIVVGDATKKSSLTLVVASPDAVGLILPQGMRCEGNPALVRSTAEQIEQDRQAAKSRKPSPSPKPATGRDRSGLIAPAITEPESPTDTPGSESGKPGAKGGHNKKQRGLGRLGTPWSDAP